MMRAAWLVLAVTVWGAPLSTRAAEPQTPAPADTSHAAPADTSHVLAPVPANFDLIVREDYVRRHAFSLDHFLEFEPGGVLARLGPIGNDAFYSRWGIGRGRALVVLNGIPINNPQDGTAPFLDIATSGLSTISLDTRVDHTYEPGIEGTLTLRDLVPARSRPHTFIELSKGTNEVRQRRVRFGSEAGKIGLDLSYDEVLNDGYDFDANGVLGGVSPEGIANSRNSAVAVRGELANDATYAIGLRRYRSTSTGDLESPLNESSRGGHLAWASVGKGGAAATVYGRGYTTSRPDSDTTNETVGGVVAWDARRGRTALRLYGLGEHTNATQAVQDTSAFTRTTNVGAGAHAEVGSGALTWFAEGNLANDEQQGAWGAGGGVSRDVPGGDVTLSVRRVFRLPTISERYLPAHARDGYVVSGDRALDPETAMEGSAEWTLRSSTFTNRVRASWIRSEGHVTFAAVPGDSLLRRAANSTETPTMTFVEERLGLNTAIGALEIRADAGGWYTTGDRTGAFQSVPRAQVNASLLCGMQLFEKSSALYVGGEYAFVDERRDYNGVPLSSYQVVNLSLVGRLIDARVYVRWLNLLDESYETVSGYLMTPRTLAYGIEWTLFD